MEKRCEFCMALRPIVYCKADAAHLCLSCDAKVHSANALSFRHPRTLVCESCRYQPAIVRCYDHQMFMCQSCDTSHHVSFQHQKRLVSCFVGCPSAKELAALWGFELEGRNWTEKDQSFGSNESCSRSEVSSVSVFYREAEGGSTGRVSKVVKDNNMQQNSYLIPQQIEELERLQLSEGIENSYLLHVKERMGGLLFRHDNVLELPKTLNHHTENSEQTGNPLEDRNEDPLSSSSPFSQLEQLTSSGNPLQGDSFWQCKSPTHNNEIWLENMQDLGVCDEVQCFEDVNIPDVDLTFRNFEEIFGSDHDPIRGQLVNDENMSCSFADQLDHRVCASTIEELNNSEKVQQLQIIDNHTQPIRPSHSASSFSVSRITGESSSSEYKDDELSPTFPTQLLPYDHSDNTKLDSKANVTMRYKEKKLMRKRGKGQVLKVEDDSTSVTRSF